MLNSLGEPVRISFVIPIILGDSQTTQGQQGPLDSSQVFACKYATVPFEHIQEEEIDLNISLLIQTIIILLKH